MHPTKHEVILAIRDAFDRVDRENGVTLHEADVMDMYGSDAERAVAREQDTDRIWEQVPDSDIERYDSALSFFDPKGFRYYIPAYMIWALKNCGRTHSCSFGSTLFHLTTLDEPEKYQSARLEILDQKQRTAIALFLLYFAADPLHGSEPRNAIHRFWDRFLPDAFRDASVVGTS